MLYKDAWQSIGRSPGRFIALVLLMLLGTFSFVGLKITGPDMRQTGMNYFNQTHLADMTVTSAYGLNQADQKTITDQAQVRPSTTATSPTPKLRAAPTASGSFPIPVPCRSIKWWPGAWPRQTPKSP